MSSKITCWSVDVDLDLTTPFQPTEAIEELFQFATSPANFSSINELDLVCNTTVDSSTGLINKFNCTWAEDTFLWNTDQWMPPNSCTSSSFNDSTLRSASSLSSIPLTIEELPIMNIADMLEPPTNMSPLSSAPSSPVQYAVPPHVPLPAADTDLSKFWDHIFQANNVTSTSNDSKVSHRSPSSPDGNIPQDLPSLEWPQSPNTLYDNDLPLPPITSTSPPDDQSSSATITSSNIKIGVRCHSAQPSIAGDLPISHISTNTRKSRSKCKLLPPVLSYPSNLIPLNAPVQVRRRAASENAESNSSSQSTSPIKSNALRRNCKRRKATLEKSADDEILEALPTNLASLDPREAKRIKNTLSARKSRARKAAKIDFLEAKVNDLESINERLRSVVRKLQTQTVTWAATLLAEKDGRAASPGLPNFEKLQQIQRNMLLAAAHTASELEVTEKKLSAEASADEVDEQ